jgi:DNA polymerase III sliding clamp (beta) subunit (PCNA family)
MLADLSVIPNVPDLKQLPPFNVEIKLDSNFISKFIKAKGALADENNFTFTCKDGAGQMILGYSNINTNRINIDVDCTCEGDVEPISFSATYLKEILVANKEATDATLKISSQGLSHISFEVDNYESNYYLVEIQS